MLSKAKASGDEVRFALKFIREHIFRLDQSKFGEIAGASKATVSRWESGRGFPDALHLSRVRSFAVESGVEWDDRLFFEVPKSFAGAPADERRTVAA